MNIRVGPINSTFKDEPAFLEQWSININNIIHTEQIILISPNINYW
jgi:hypothetical protein